jgi:hypothetical protein
VYAGYVDLHELVDRLSPAQADAVREVVRHLVAAVQPAVPAGDRGGVVPRGEPHRRLSFAGALRSGRGDLAARSEEIIRAELGRA